MTFFEKNLVKGYLLFLLVGKSRIVRKSGICIFVPLMLFCGKSEQPYTIETKDGVKYVHNRTPLWGDEPKVALEFVRQIGELDTKDENYMFYKIRDLARDANGNLYVLDAGNFRIQKFDPQVRYLATIGRKGLGPGEFTRPVTINVDSCNNIYIGDSNFRKVIVFSPEGKEIKRITMPGSFGGFCLMKSGNIVLDVPASIRVKYQKEPKKIAELPLLYMIDQEGNILREFGRSHDFKNGEKTYYGNVNSIALDTHDNIYVAFHFLNRIEKYSPDGNLLFRADRPLNYNLSYKLKPQEYDLIGLEGVKYTVNLPDFTEVSRNIGIDHKNRVWVQTYKKQKEENDEAGDYFEFEVFSEDGILLGKVPVPQAGSTQIIQDRIYFINSQEEMCVYEYKIIDK